ncbi:hypothetical protein DL897_03025 [Thermoflavimicrobium daqui]|uniref:SPOR domain-containing protein n=1 Tax=Thermoflavimicrobium daqui TaxID=2137476 RepID=A0A364K9R0_9BACL|nr:hypothetical protein DL897_03025 [Thermoflavimicrobium daqui]
MIYENALNRLNHLHEKGFLSSKSVDAFVDGEYYTRILVSSFNKQSQAIQLVNELKSKGLEAFWQKEK